MAVERTLVLIKPDAVQRKLAGEILARFEQRGLELRDARLVQVDRKLAEEHYAEHAEKPFFGDARAGARGRVGDLGRPHDDGLDQSGRVRARDDPRRPRAGDARQPGAWLGLAGVGEA